MTEVFAKKSFADLKVGDRVFVIYPYRSPGWEEVTKVGRKYFHLGSFAASDMDFERQTGKHVTQYRECHLYLSEQEYRSKLQKNSGCGDNHENI